MGSIKESLITTVIFGAILHLAKNKLDLTILENTKFKREHCYKQLKELYLHLYAIINQSEFLRVLLFKEDSFYDYPFFEIEHKNVTKNIDFSSDNLSKIIEEAISSGNIVSGDISELMVDVIEEDLVNEITLDNKERLVFHIIKNKQYAS